MIAAGVVLYLCSCESISFSGDEQALVESAVLGRPISGATIDRYFRDGTLALEWAPNDDSIYFEFDDELEIYCPRSPSVGSRCLLYVRVVGKEMGLFPTQSRDFIYDARVTVRDGMVIAGTVGGKGIAGAFGVEERTLMLDTNRVSENAVRIWMTEKADNTYSCIVEVPELQDGASVADACFFSAGVPAWVSE
jgi:hypothetical protein